MAAAELRVICGPTAAGKTTLAIALAEQLGARIISADSRQIYRGFDIGTAKPTAEEQSRVHHYGVDVAEPTTRYSAAAWAAGAERWLTQSAAAGPTPMVVGGTGFYIRALTEPLFTEPTLDTARRHALAQVLDAMPIAELRRWCEQLDPPRAHLGRTQLLRAIEVALLTGVPISVWHAHTPRAPGRAARYLLVDPGAVLASRIAERVHAMFAAGWPDEVAALATAVPDDAPAWNATGYSIVRDYVRGRVSRAAAIEQVTIHTRQYAKRQRTWFRHQLPRANVTVLDPALSDATRRALAWWTASEDEAVR